MAEPARVPWPALPLMGAHRCGAGAHVSQSRGDHNKPGIYTQVLRQNPSCFRRKSVFLSLPPTRDGVVTLSVRVPVTPDLPEEDVSVTQLTVSMWHTLSAATQEFSPVLSRH